MDKKRLALATGLALSGPAMFGELAAMLTRRIKPIEPVWLRRGYEAGIVDELREFYARRPRPWRPAARSSCKPSFKERLKAKRRAHAQ